MKSCAVRLVERPALQSWVGRLLLKAFEVSGKALR